MDKSFLINIHNIFIATRFDITSPVGLAYMKLAKQQIDNGGQNKLFLNDVKEEYLKSRLAWWEPLSLSDKITPSLNVGQNFVKVYSHVLSKIIYLLKEEDFVQAYEVIDAFHWIPDAITRGIKINWVSFFISVVIPLGVRWGMNFADELFALLTLSRFSKIRVNIALSHAKRKL